MYEWKPYPKEPLFIRYIRYIRYIPQMHGEAHDQKHILSYHIVAPSQRATFGIGDPEFLTDSYGVTPYLLVPL